MGVDEEGEGIGGCRMLSLEKWLIEGSRERVLRGCMYLCDHAFSSCP